MAGMLQKAMAGLKGQKKRIDRAVQKATHPGFKHPNNGMQAGRDVGFENVDAKFQASRRGMENTDTPWGMAEAVATAKRDKRKGK